MAGVVYYILNTIKKMENILLVEYLRMSHNNKVSTSVHVIRPS